MKKTQLLLSLLLIIPLLLTSCSEKDPLLGKWQEPITGITLEFNNDNTLVIERDGTSFTVDYEKREPNIIAITSTGSVALPVQSMTYKIVEDQLIVTVDQVDTVFTRIKK
jgi:hypothetical protein